ncbi:hypothetical protein F5Y14DRAFT_450403 [Nemania sp. NC0429]|nr:hypothetical protein F5Y14DRAFT_450403 [Nemania sp. NC0429]
MAFRPSMQQIMETSSITLMSATYDADGQVCTRVILGPEEAVVTSSLPEEGVYLICKNHGLQLSSPCERRRCYTTQICHCTEQQQDGEDDYTYRHMTLASTSIVPAADAGTRQQKGRGLTRYFAPRSRARAPSFQDSPLARLYFFEAAEATRSLKFCFRASPRTLSLARDDALDDLVLEFDSGLGGGRQDAMAPQDCGSRNGGGSKGGSINGLRNRYRNGIGIGYGYGRKLSFLPWVGERPRPAEVTDILREAWKGFIDRGDHHFGPVKIFSGPGWGWEDSAESGSQASKDEDLDGDDESDEHDKEDEEDKDWDDADSPISKHSHPHMLPRPDLGESFSIVAMSNSYEDYKKTLTGEGEGEGEGEGGTQAEKASEKNDMDSSAISLDFDLELDSELDLDFEFYYSGDEEEEEEGESSAEKTPTQAKTEAKTETPASSCPASTAKDDNNPWIRAVNQAVRKRLSY